MRTIDCENSIFPKSSRFTYKRNGVFFKTRKKDLFGPYKNIGEATHALDIYLALMRLHDETSPRLAA